MSKCDHIVGAIAGKGIKSSSWNKDLTAFVSKIIDFNVRGQRDQINHPGFLEECKFCTQCGHEIDRKALNLRSYREVFSFLSEGLNDSSAS